MATCPPNLTHSFFTGCKIITFKVNKKVFSHAPERDNKVLKAKKTIFKNRYGTCSSISMFLSK